MGMSRISGVLILANSSRPFYVRGCAVGCGFTGLIVVLALTLHFLLEAENRKRDRLYGSVDEDTQVDVTVAGDKNVSFRYLT